MFELFSATWGKPTNTTGHYLLLQRSVLTGAGRAGEQPNYSLTRPAPAIKLRNTAPAMYDVQVIDLYGILCIESLMTASPLAEARPASQNLSKNLLTLLLSFA